MEQAVKKLTRDWLLRWLVENGTSDARITAMDYAGWQAYQYAMNNRLIEKRHMNGNIRITKDGIKFIKEYENDK